MFRKGTKKSNKIGKEVKHLKYEDRLQALQLFLLKYRRLRGMLIGMYKILTGKVNVRTEQFLNCHLRDYVTQRTQSEAIQAICIKMLNFSRCQLWMNGTYCLNQL